MAGRRQRPLPVLLLMVSLATLSGCYTMRPITGPMPEPGARVALDIGDAGRTALGGLIGPEVRQVEGRLLEQSAEDYLLAVSSIKLLRGGEQVWRGEQVRIRREYVTGSHLKQFSMGRSLTLGIGVVGGFTAFLATRSLLGGGQITTPTPIDSASSHVGRF